MTWHPWASSGLLVVLLLVGCGDVEVRGRLVSESGPGFAGYAFQFEDAESLAEHIYDSGIVEADGSFSAVVSADALRAGRTYVSFTREEPFEQVGALLRDFADGAPDVVNLGELHVWNPQVRVQVTDSGIQARWTPPPPGLGGTTSIRMDTMQPDLSAGELTVPAWIFEDRYAGLYIRWDADSFPDDLLGLDVTGFDRAPETQPSAAADAPCYGYRVDPDNQTRSEGVIDPCVLTDRNRDTSFDLDSVSAEEGDTRGISVELGQELPVTRIVVRAEAAAPAAHVLVAGGDTPARFVGDLSSAVTVFILDPPAMASRVFVESEEPVTIVDVAAFTPDEL